ncbi:MAG: GNAT family N-acetyltransferase [Neomegalonema sp.]|nr:GNAT family N-acetyltransferase [Neomegalonema sp.]
MTYAISIRWNETPRARWDRVLKLTDAALQQDWAFGEAMARHGAGLLRAEVRRGPQILALAQFTLRDVAGLAHWALCTRGPVWVAPLSEAERSQIYLQLRREAPLRRVRALFFTPNDGDGPDGIVSAGLRRVMTGYSTVSLDLSRSLSDLRGAMHQKWRNRLVRAEQSPLRITEAPPRPASYRWLLDREQEQRKRRGYAAHPIGITEAFDLASAAKRSVRLFEARSGSDICAAMLFLCHGRGATYQIGWSDDAGRRFGAHNALLWHAASHLQQAGIRSLDLGGVDTETSPGLARFKLGTGGRAITLSGTYF